MSAEAITVSTTERYRVTAYEARAAQGLVDAGPAAFWPQDPKGQFVRRCLRHVGVELLEVDGREVWAQASGLRCPVDGAPVRVWEVWDRVNSRRYCTADEHQGAHVEQDEVTHIKLYHRVRRAE